MSDNIIVEKQDLTYLKWSHVRSSSGTAGTFLKSQSTISGEKIYYKLSAYDSEKGIVGHECINEMIADRLLTILGVEHLHYKLIHADVEIDNKKYETWLCASKDFKKRGESKAALDHFYLANREENESRYDFCIKYGWRRYIDTMLVVDYLLLNRDRHGANIEVLRDARKHNIRIAPLFDHGLSLLCTCYTDKEIEQFDVLEDKPCQNFFGSRSTFENLKLVEDIRNVFQTGLEWKHKEVLFKDLEAALSETHRDKIWNMLWSRWCEYEKLCNL